MEISLKAFLYTVRCYPFSISRLIVLAVVFVNWLSSIQSTNMCTSIAIRTCEDNIKLINATHKRTLFKNNNDKNSVLQCQTIL